MSKPEHASNIQIRMYNVGFGDSFLLSVPTPSGVRRMLVDCGYHSQGKGQFSDKELVTQIQADLEGNGLDVVVATHRHQDHISAFGEADLWEKIPVEEVWLPFTADPAAAAEDPALRAWQGLMDSAHALLEGAKLNATATAALAARSEEERQAAAFMLWNARSNSPGIDNLLRGMRRSDGTPSKRRFLPEPANRTALSEEATPSLLPEPSAAFPSRLETPALPGAIIHILGPPRAPEDRKKRRVPPSWGIADGGIPAGSQVQPGSCFGSEWRVPLDRLPTKRPFKDTSLQKFQLFNDDLLRAAAALDGFLNGESLVLVLQLGGARLLLPGDAEVGTWTAILDNPKALELAASATFLKVGHHGSQNATPLVFIREHLAKKTPAVISTQQGEGNYRHGIPLPGLVKALKARGMPFVRSDIPPLETNAIFKPDEQKRWVDCTIPC